MSAPQHSRAELNSTMEEDVPKIRETKHPLPEAKGDPWSTLLEPLMKDDHHRCAAWKDEVQNLLIFAGLFSAVVTAFLVESYKTLREDPLQTAVALLNKIVVNGTAVGASAALPDPSHFSPTPSDVRVNAVWFLSLTISLSAVLIGVLSLQWLREYQRPRGDHSPRILLSLFEMHEEALERWYLPQIFAALPLLLQLNLVLFLCGMIDFLCHLNVAVATPSAVAIGLTLLLLVLSTVLPSLQAFTLLFPRRASFDKPRAPCAYKSPQAWLFHRFLVKSVPLIVRFLVKSVSLIMKFRLPDRLPFISFQQEFASELGRYPSTQMVFHSRRQARISSWETWCPESNPTDMMIWKTKGTSWLDHRIAWLFQRDIERMCQHEDTALLAKSEFLTEAVPLYDAVNVLLRRLEIAGRSSRRTPQLIAAFHCFTQLFELTISNELNYSPRKNLYLLHVHSLLTPNWSGLPMCTLARSPSIDSAKATIDALRNDFLLAVHRKFFSSDHFPPEMKRNAVERCIHLTDWTFGHKHRLIDEDFRHGHTSLAIQWLANQMPQLAIRNDNVPDVHSQIVHILESFFSYAMKFHPSEKELGATTHTTLYARHFLEASSKIIKSTRDETVLSAHDRVLASLFTKLRPSSSLSSSADGEPSSIGLQNKPGSQFPDYLLVVAIVYIRTFYSPVKTDHQAVLKGCLVEARKDAQRGAYLSKLAGCLNSRYQLTSILGRPWKTGVDAAIGAPSNVMHVAIEQNPTMPDVPVET